MWIYFISGLLAGGAICGTSFFLSNKKKKKKESSPDVNTGDFLGEMAENLIHSVSDMIFIVDKEYRIRRILNSDPEKLLMPVESIIGMSLQDCVDPEYREQILQGIEETLHSDKVKEVEYTVSLSGETFYFEGRFKRIQDGWVACFERNATNRKLYEESLVEARKAVEKIQRRNQLILNNANSVLVYINSDYMVEWENVDEQVSVHPLATNYKEGIHCYETVMGLSEPCKVCIARRALENKSIEKEELHMEDGIVVAITASPVTNEEGQEGVVLKYDDVTTERKVAEELRQAKETAEASDKLKSMFLSNMSHEIRTPLNAIVGFSELLTSAEDQEEKEEFALLIRRNNDLLLHLINDILDLSKIEAGTIEFVYSNVELNELFKNIELNYALKIGEGTGLEIRFMTPSDDCIIRTEKSRVQQVLQNMASNALKFTEKGTVNIGYEVRDNDMRFFVSDTGRGIPKEKQKEIFQRFVKLDSFVPGTGLGLAICQTIIEKMGGKIGVESEEGKGATFWFTLPVLPVNKKLACASMLLANRTISNSQKAGVAEKEANRQPVILIAEDMVDNFKLYQAILGTKYTLLHGWNGKEAVDLFHEHETEIDIVLMDIKMPVMDGYEAIEIIRQTNRTTPIIAVSAYAFSEDIARIQESGFNHFLSKPINKTELLDTLKGLG